MALSNLYTGLIMSASPFTPISVRTLLRTLITQLDHIYSHGPVVREGALSCGLRSIDAASGGIQCTDVWLLGCMEPSPGTDLLLQMATHVAAQEQKVMFLSSRTSPVHLTAQLLAQQQHITFDTLQSWKPDIADETWSKLNAAVLAVSELNLVFGQITADTDEALLEQLTLAVTTKSKPALLILDDYLLMAYFSRTEATARLLPALKQWCTQWQVPLIIGGPCLRNQASCYQADMVLWLDSFQHVLNINARLLTGPTRIPMVYLEPFRYWFEAEVAA